ncbi:BRO family protein [Pseudomonas sp.]|uniref:BRO-N domain-containing protein n=1 Tax=Pseudomonas sp. TaxID=306 RepID=UPI002586D00B|nr:BRO family protein [Pseudomonas sp.]
MQSAQVIPFRFESIEVRAFSDEAGEPWFCAADVCSALGYANTSKAISDNCRVAGVTSSYIRSGGQSRSVKFINEGNLYRLIIKSRKEEAQRFESWVCDEVLPAIRKQGRYEDSEGKMNTLVGQTIGTDGFHMLGAVVKGKVSSLPAPVQRRATAKIWSQTHAAFGVRSAADIPADQLDAARNFIAAYALEGEWLGREPKHQPNLNYPITTLTARRPSMLTIRNSDQAWLDVTLHDLRDIRGDETPCEKLLGELHKAGYDIEGCWWELRTYRNKVLELQSWAKGMNQVAEKPQRYAVEVSGKRA